MCWLFGLCDIPCPTECILGGTTLTFFQNNVVTGGNSPRNQHHIILIGLTFGCVQHNHLPWKDLSTYTNTPVRMNGIIFNVFVVSSIGEDDDFVM